MTQQPLQEIDPITPTPSLQIAFQGERGAFSYEASLSYFSTQQAEFNAYRSFADVFHAVAVGEANYGLVPVENSQAGSINEVYDSLGQHDLYVVGEISHQVRHSLLCLPGQKLSDIHRVISHPQALAQSDTFLRELGVETVATYNTAGSAKMIQDEQLQGVAAVASEGAAELYGLEILAHDIQTITDNYTRFIVLGREPAPRQEGPAKTMLVMATAHQAGSLHRCLGILAERQINLLKLESRPSRQRPWEYVFYLDFSGHREDPDVRSAIADLARYTLFCKVLGSYPRDLH